MYRAKAGLLRRPSRSCCGTMGRTLISSYASTNNSLLNYLTTQTAQTATGTGSTATSTTSASVTAKLAATADAALKAAASTHQSTVAENTLEKQQKTLASDLRAALNKAGVKLNGEIEYSVGSDGAVSMKASDADKTAMTAFLKADTGKPSFASRIATQARDALKLSSTIQQHAAISQAAHYGGKSGGVMQLYTSLMAQPRTGAAVFSVSAASSSLTYPGSLTAKA